MWFGVGRATIARVEAGEIVPGHDLEQRIGRYLTAIGRAPVCCAAPRAPFTHCGAPTGGGAAEPRGPSANLGADSPGGAPIQSNRGTR